MPVKAASYRSTSGAQFRLYAHLIFVTKYRKNILRAEHLTHLVQIYTEICSEENCVLVECNGEPNHVHLLVDYPPTVAIADLVRRLKAVSSRRLRLADKSLAWRRALWSPSYFAASCGGAPIEVLRRYIEAQNKPP